MFEERNTPQIKEKFLFIRCFFRSSRLKLSLHNLGEKIESFKFIKLYQSNKLLNEQKINRKSVFYLQTGLIFLFTLKINLMKFVEK